MIRHDEHHFNAAMTACDAASEAGDHSAAQGHASRAYKIAHVGNDKPSAMRALKKLHEVTTDHVMARDFPDDDDDRDDDDVGSVQAAPAIKQDGKSEVARTAMLSRASEAWRKR